MSDLAAMLSDLHDDNDLPHREQLQPAPEPLRTKLPEWASEEALDAAFANWVPGPQVEANHNEHSLFSDLSEVADADVSSYPPAAEWAEAAEAMPFSIDAPLSVDPPATATTDAPDAPFQDPVDAAAAHAVALGRALAGDAATAAPIAPPAPAFPTAPAAPALSLGPRTAPAARETPLAELIKGSNARPDDDILPGRGQKAKRRWFRR